MAPLKKLSKELPLKELQEIAKKEGVSSGGKKSDLIRKIEKKRKAEKEPSPPKKVAKKKAKSPSPPKEKKVAKKKVAKKAKSPSPPKKVAKKKVAKKAKSPSPSKEKKVAKKKASTKKKVVAKPKTPSPPKVKKVAKASKKGKLLIKCVDDDGKKFCPDDKFCLYEDGKKAKCVKSTKKGDPAGIKALKVKYGENYHHNKKYNLIGDKAQIEKFVKLLEKAGVKPAPKKKTPPKTPLKDKSCADKDDFLDCGEDLCDIDTGKCVKNDRPGNKDKYVLTYGKRVFVGDKDSLTRLRKSFGLKAADHKLTKFGGGDGEKKRGRPSSKKDNVVASKKSKKSSCADNDADVCPDDKICNAESGRCVADSKVNRKDKYILDIDGRIFVSSDESALKAIAKDLGSNAVPIKQAAGKKEEEKLPSPPPGAPFPHTPKDDDEGDIHFEIPPPVVEETQHNKTPKKASIKKDAPFLPVVEEKREQAREKLEEKKLSEKIQAKEKTPKGNAKQASIMEAFQRCLSSISQ